MADDYNPFVNRPPEQLTSSAFACFMHLLKAAIGSGILVLPHAFSTTGYLASIMCSIFVGSLSVYTAVLTVQCSQLLCKRTRVPSMSFAETAEASFNNGPEPFRKYGKAFGMAVIILVCFVQYQTCIIYSLYISTTMMQVFEYFTEWKQSIRVYIVLFMPIYWLLSLIPNFSWLVPFSVVGSILIFFGVGCTLYYLLLDFESPSRLPAFTDFPSLMIYSTIFLFAVHNMSMIMPMENSIRKPEKMSIVLSSSMVLNIIVNVLFGFLGFNKYPTACDSIANNLPMDEPMAILIKVSIALSVLLTYGLQYFVPIKILWPMIAEKVGDIRLYEVAFRLGGVTICTMLAVALPHLASVLGIFSALSMTTVMLLVPILIETTTKWNDPGKLNHYILIGKNAFILIVYGLLLICGFINNTEKLVHEITEYHKPDPMCT